MTKTYERGKPLEPLTVIGETKKRGTLVRFILIQKFSQKQLNLVLKRLSARLRELAFFNKKLRITITDERIK